MDFQSTNEGRLKAGSRFVSAAGAVALTIFGQITPRAACEKTTEVEEASLAVHAEGARTLE